MNKRSEFHCHTIMSKMTGIADVRELIRTAQKLGMPAIAITDNESVQAYPDAFYEWRNLLRDNEDTNGIKLLYGVEVGLVDDVEAIATNEKGQCIEGEYVVFAIETTGFSPVKDRIIEIGAVRIKDGKIMDTFSSFINPGIHISYEMTAFMGIDDTMVADAERIEQVLPKFIDFCRDAVLVAHNASFDISFIKENMQRQKIWKEFTVLDTLNLSRVLLEKVERFTIGELAVELGVYVGSDHRAVDDSKVFANIFLAFLDMLKDKGIKNLRELNDMAKGNECFISRLKAHRVIMIATSAEGIKNIYKLLSISEFDYSKPQPRVPRSMLEKNRLGVIIGGCAQDGDVSGAITKSQREEDIKKLMSFYDFIEVEPINNYIYSLGLSSNLGRIGTEDVKESIRKVVKIGKELNVPVIASSNVYYVNKVDKEAFRVLRHAAGLVEREGWKAKHHLMSTKEMLDEFSFLGEMSKEIVIDNPNSLAESIGILRPINRSKKYPKYPDAEKTLKAICNNRAHEIYGMMLPQEVKSRIDHELGGIIENGFASIYMMAYEIVKESNEAGYIIEARGSSGASFVSFLLGISEMNPLPAHYRCGSCGYVDFRIFKSNGYKAGDVGLDLPDAICPKCGKKLVKDGYDLPMETFLGLQVDKEPDFDFNISRDYWLEVIESVRSIEGIDTIIRPVGIATLSASRAVKYAKKYYEGKKIKKNKDELFEIENKIMETRMKDVVKPGGIIVIPNGVDVCAYTPISPGLSDGIPKTQLDSSALDGALMKLDFLEYSVPAFLKYLFDETGIDPLAITMEDDRIMSLFSRIEALGIKSDQIGGVNVGTLGVPEFGYYRIIKALEFFRPERLSDIIKISSMTHAAWDCDPFEYVTNKQIPISECIGTRDDIMHYLMDKGISRDIAFCIMEKVRKGQGRSDMIKKWSRELLESGVPEWYRGLLGKIYYLFPKAHSANYTLNSWRLLYYKLYYPKMFYKGWLKFVAHEVDETFVKRGYDNAKREFEQLCGKDYKKMGYRQQNRIDNLLVVMEMYARGISLDYIGG